MTAALPSSAVATTSQCETWSQRFYRLILQVMEMLVPHLCNHSLCLLGEPGKGKTPLERIVAMLFSRFHGGDGSFRSTSDLDFFRGIHFTKGIPALHDGDIGNEAEPLQMWPTMRL